MPGHRLITVSALVLSLAGAQVAFAADEQGDAGQGLADAQDVTGEAATSINGSFDSASDVDLYKVCVTGGGGFSASTVGGSTLDTQLFLFDGDGMGVYANDDVGGGPRQSLLPAGHALTPTARGVYYLGVSQWNIDPQSRLGPIFPASLAGLVGATERGAGDPLSTWSGSLGRGPGAYTVALTGTEACGVVDETPPGVTITSPAEGLRVGLGATVNVDFSCSDEGGSELASCVGSVEDGGTLDTSALGTTTLTVTARDNAGNETVATRDVQVVDETAPAIALERPADGATYALGEDVEASYSCTDESGSGTESCEGDVPDGGALDTSSAGWKTFTVRARDRAGNESTKTARYHVGYGFDGFAWPLADFPRVTTWRAGVPVPVRFSLGGNQGVDAVDAVQVAEVECGAGETPDAGEPASLASRSKPVRYSRRRDEYRLLWRTERSWQGGCRQLLVKLDDGSTQRAEVRFVRRSYGFWPWDD